jgi:hypothetical protein
MPAWIVFGPPPPEREVAPARPWASDFGVYVEEEASDLTERLSRGEWARCTVRLRGENRATLWVNPASVLYVREIVRETAD